MSTIRLYLDDDEALAGIRSLLQAARQDMYMIQLHHDKCGRDHATMARDEIRLARKIAGILPETMIPSELRTIEHAIAIALTEGTRHEGSK